jgi:hypothetical protein
MKTYEIINPSDPYTMRADDFLIAAVTVAMLGNGKYGIEGSPILFGWDAFFEKHEIDLPKFIDAHLEEIIACMDSVLIGRESNRIDVESALEAMTPENRESYLEKWIDRRRSSMNDIGAGAKRWADALRKKASKLSAASTP